MRYEVYANVCILRLFTIDLGYRMEEKEDIAHFFSIFYPVEEEKIIKCGQFFGCRSNKEEKEREKILNHLSNNMLIHTSYTLSCVVNHMTLLRLTIQIMYS
jgi:hypothetical protein